MSELHDNAAAEQYELVLNGETVFARYRKSAGVLTVLWVESPPVLRGTGAAGKLMNLMAERGFASFVTFATFGVTFGQGHTRRRRERL